MCAARSFPGNDVFEQAKGLSLNDFLQRELGVAAKTNRLYVRYPSCPNPECRAAVNRLSVRLVVRDDRSFRCFRCGAYGSIVDAAMLLWGFDNPLAAARTLAGESAVPAKRDSILTPEYLAEVHREAERLRQALLAIRAAADVASDDPVNLRYLTRERCIPLDIVREAQARRLLGFLPSSRQRAKELLLAYVGQDLLQAAGLWNPEYREPWIASRPLIFFFPGMQAAEFRLNRSPGPREKKALRKGSADYPWFWRGSDATRAIIVEGFIDLLSVAAMGYPGHVVGFPGCNNWQPEWLCKLQETGVRFVDIGLDDDFDSPDNPGRLWAGILADCLDEIGIDHRMAKPVEGDMNALLKARQTVAAP